MNTELADHRLRSLPPLFSRRGWLVRTTSGLLAMLPLALTGEDAAAKRKKRKSKKRGHKKQGNAPATSSPPPPEPSVSPPPDSPAPVACVPNCASKTCGDDGCGGLCGVCGLGQQCCGSICAANTVCCGGCGAGQQCCAGICANAASNATHCGACGVACPSGSCIHGVCTCEGGSAQCPGAGCGCESRLGGGAVCSVGFTATACVDDTPCPLGSACIFDGTGGRCSIPC
jgi:hypothetical protein